MLGTKIYKPLQDNTIPVYNEGGIVTSYEINTAPNTYSKYTELATWCNQNGATIVDSGDYYECVKCVPKTLSKKEQAEQRIAELKHNLNETDYISAKLAEGVATKEEYAKELSQREAWRAEIRELEKTLEV